VKSNACFTGLSLAWNATPFNVNAARITVPSLDGPPGPSAPHFVMLSSFELGISDV